MLTTLDRAPPPIFRQGYSALTKLVFFSAVSLFLMAADNRLTIVAPLRAAIANALNPAQRALLVPVAAAKDSTEYLKGLREAKQGEESAKAALAAQALKAAEADKLTAENLRLRALLELKPSLTVRHKAAEVLYEANDPFSRKIFIDQGTSQGVLPGSPVVTERGVVGQVTRVYRISAEVTLVVDRNAAVPVVNARTQQRLAAYGAGDPLAPMELRFVSSAADVQVGDSLITSGLDGVYPPGLNVAKVTLVERHGIAGGFTRVVLEPSATLDTLKHVLVLDPLGAQMPERPVEEPESNKRVKGKRGSKNAKTTKDADKGTSKAESTPTDAAPESKPEANGRTAP